LTLKIGVFIIQDILFLLFSLLLFEMF